MRNTPAQPPETGSFIAPLYCVLFAVLFVVALARSHPSHASGLEQQAGFAKWREAFWPDAQAFGIRRKTFDEALGNVTIDESLPDLQQKTAAKKPRKGQAEFTRPPQAYVSEKQIARLASQGRTLAARHEKLLADIQEQFGVPSNVVLAIWGRETAYGRYQPKHDGVRALATQAFMGRRSAMFRQELLHALKLLDTGVLTRGTFQTSWAGAFGLTQFMPSEFEKLAVDFDRDGKTDLWSTPDALASAANQLKQKGWITGQPWGYEVAFSPGVTCAEDGPNNMRPVSEWFDRGVRRVANRRFSQTAMTFKVFPFSPGGGFGPQFLATENFLVFKRYNMSDLYALFVGHLADRIAGSGRFIKSWGAIGQLPGSQIAAIQSELKQRQYAIGKIDGRIGSNTRSQIGAYQLRRKLAVDCWPSAQLLKHLENTK